MADQLSSRMGFPLESPVLQISALISASRGRFRRNGSTVEQVSLQSHPGCSWFRQFLFTSGSGNASARLSIIFWWSVSSSIWTVIDKGAIFKLWRKDFWKHSMLKTGPSILYWRKTLQWNAKVGPFVYRTLKKYGGEALPFNNANTREIVATGHLPPTDWHQIYVQKVTSFLTKELAMN